MVERTPPPASVLPTPGNALELSDGMYRVPDEGSVHYTGGTIFKIQHAIHGSGRQYAKKLVVLQEAMRDEEGDILEAGAIRFEYAPGAIFKIQPEWRMTMEQATAFGALYGTCVRCGKTLTKEKSINRAMGPVCAGKI